jgi:N-acetylglucosamine kinase-like BadF-type ATPase
VRKELAQLARGVTKAAQRGDETALKLVQHTATGLADHVRAVARATDLEQPIVGLVGGVFAGGEPVRSSVVDAIVSAVPGSQPRFLEDFDAADGVLQLGGLLLGLDPLPGVRP